MEIFEFRCDSGTFDRADAKWHRTTRCRQGQRYAICEEETESPAPETRVISLADEWGEW